MKVRVAVHISDVKNSQTFLYPEQAVALFTANNFLSSLCVSAVGNVTVLIVNFYKTNGSIFKSKTNYKSPMSKNYFAPGRIQLKSDSLTIEITFALQKERTTQKVKTKFQLIMFNKLSKICKIFITDS